MDERKTNLQTVVYDGDLKMEKKVRTLLNMYIQISVD
jgi:hypothetical protein